MLDINAIRGDFPISVKGIIYLDSAASSLTRSIDLSQRIGIVSFNIQGISPHDVALSLDAEFDIAICSGHHCALPLMKELFGLPEGTARASMYLYNTLDEIDLLLGAVEGLAHTAVG